MTTEQHEARYQARVREYAQELNERVIAGEMSSYEANVALVEAQDRWINAPWG